MRLSEFTGARRIPLIGRQELLLEAERRMGRGGVHLLYLEGDGGIGKTALVEAILDRSQRFGRAEALTTTCVAKEVIDLYHADVHTAEGMMRRIIDVLGKWSFEQSIEALSLLDAARAAGETATLGKQTEALQAAFLQEFGWLTEGGVVLAFDTMEVLEYELDPFQEELDQEVPISSAGDWLFKVFFPALRGNALVLLAGRPDSMPQKLEALRERNAHLLVHHVLMPALSEEETAGYLRAIAQVEGKRGDPDAAARLWSFSEEKGDVVHLLTGGRPILLALIADLLAHGWVLPPPFDQGMEELGQRAEEAVYAEVERALVVHIQESPTPIGDTLRAMGWLRKGATPGLLARVMDLKTSEGEWDVYTATGYLEQVTQLALVKVRPGTRRVFLHDEMYALLEHHILQGCSEEDRDQIYDAIRAYYREQIRELEQRIEQFPPGFASARARMRQAYVEEVHYRLRQSPPMGFALYFWLAEEALGGRDAEMDMLLRTEFLRTLGMLKDSGYHMGYIPRDAEVDTAVRWGMRALFLQAAPDRALQLFDQVRRRWGRDAGKLRLAWAHLQLQEAMAKIQRAEGTDWPEARDLLDSVEQACDEALYAPPESPVVRGRRWQARIIKSLALNYRGYLDRQQGRYLEAVRNYQESAMLQRRLGMAALAPTLTNLSYVKAVTGEAHHARLLAEEAERLARRSGREHMLAMTLNVRALVEQQDDHHRAALRYADRALEVASRLPTPRVRGLIFLTRARAHRYLWSSLTDKEKQLDSESFPEALREANHAVKLLRDNPADRVEALLERGCLYRELAHTQQLQGKTREAQDLAEHSQQDLERVAVLSGAIDLPSQQALAWTNLGWLYYQVGQTEQIDEAIQKAQAPLPEGYTFNSHGPLPPMAQRGRKKEATLPYWSTLGKVEMLQAYRALDDALTAAERQDQEAELKQAVEHITLSLAYDELVSPNHFDLTKTEEMLHRRILQDGMSIRMLHQQAQAVAEERELDQPTRFQEFLNRMFGPAELWA